MSTSTREHVDHFRHRVMQDAWAEGTAAYWTRRADVFEWARPRPTDWPGRATRAELRARDRELQATAEACRNRTRLSLLDRGERWAG